MNLHAGLICLVTCLYGLSTTALAADAKSEPEQAAKVETAIKFEAGSKAEEKPVPEAKVSVTKHQIHIGGGALAYTATAGTMLMKNDKDEPIALFGFTAYAKDGADPHTRPIVFAYNGGPGSASAWLHMGILGPKRTVLADLEHNTRGPFRTVENEFSIIDTADLVMIDPVGTGFSRPVGKGEGKDFWGVDQDIASVSNFIVQYLSKYGRWASPKFVLGESYGGMRTGGVSFRLFTKHNVALNGVILVSPYLDVAAGSAGLRLDDPYVNFLPTFASTAWYHHALAQRPAELQPFLREAEAFAQDVYAPVLYKGKRATPAERQTVLAGLARFTGVSAEYWDRANLRLDEGRFLQQLLRDKGEVVGRVDSRYKSGLIGPLAEAQAYDPYGSSVAPAIVATFNDYYRQELKVESEREYVLSGDLWDKWDDRHAQPDLGGYKSPIANTAVDLAQAMTMNPNMKVLIQQGYFDLAVPYRTIEFVVDHLDIAPGLRDNVRIAYYDAGHMMYVHPPSMAKFKRDLSEFVATNSR
jgi:carboxypeptidase C (cathepsin A)